MVMNMHTVAAAVLRGVATVAMGATLVGCSGDPDAAPHSEVSRADAAPSTHSTAARATTTPERCGASAVAISLGRDGAWHGMTTQNVILTNAGQEPCVLHADDLREVTVASTHGAQIDIDLRPVKKDRLFLRPQRSASLTFGADATSTGCRPIARTVRVTFAGAEPVSLRHAWMAVGCETPRAVDFYRG
jgi:hypothetical protein